MAITEGNDKIPTPTPTATLGEPRNESTAPVPKATTQSNSKGVQQQAVRFPDPAPTMPDPMESSGQPRIMASMSDVDRQPINFPQQPFGQKQMQSFGALRDSPSHPQHVIGYPILPKRTATFVRTTAGHQIVNEPAYEIVAANIEEFFADYITQLPSLKEWDGVKSNDSEPKAIRTSLLLLRELREHTSAQGKYSSILGAAPDPFFASPKVPQLIPILESELGEHESITFEDYTYRLYINFPYFQMVPPQYVGIVGNFIKVGVKDNKHYLVMPDALDLLRFVEVQLKEM